MPDFTIRLPYPPTVNTYWRNVGTKTLISRRGRAYRDYAWALVRAAAAPRFRSNRLSVTITVHAKDRKKRDIDNIPKAILDALESAGTYDDDGQIDRLTVIRGEVDAAKQGYAIVEISTLSAPSV